MLLGARSLRSTPLRVCSRDLETEGVDNISYQPKAGDLCTCYVVETSEVSLSNIMSYYYMGVYVYA